MRRRRPRAAAYVPLPALPRGLSRAAWFEAMRGSWAEAYEPDSDRWGQAHTILDEAIAFEYPAAQVAAQIKALDDIWRQHE